MFDGENISFDASLVIYITSTNIPPFMIINRIYETQTSVAVACVLPDRAKNLSAPLYQQDAWRKPGKIQELSAVGNRRVVVEKYALSLYPLKGSNWL